MIDEVSGGAHEKHIYAGGIHIASNSNGVVEYYHQDHLGSTRLKTNSTAGVVYESNYEPYGPGCGETGSEDYRYTGKREDPTGLYFFGARYYDPATGRFTTLDKVFGDLTDPQSLNRYSYCRNNPHKYTDPDGNLGVIASAFVGGCLFGVVSSAFLYISETPYEQWNLKVATTKMATGGLTAGVTSAAIAAEMSLVAIAATAATVYSAARVLTHSAKYSEGELESLSDPIEYAEDFVVEVGSNTAATVLYSTNIVRRGIRTITAPIAKVSEKAEWVTYRSLRKISKMGYAKGLQDTYQMIKDRYDTWSNKEKNNYWAFYDSREALR